MRHNTTLQYFFSLCTFPSSLSSPLTPLHHPKRSLLLSLSASDSGKQKRLASSIFDMDLWKDRVTDGVSNDYGSRGAKEKRFGWGKIGKVEEGKSYVPSGLTAAEYNRIRGDTKAAKDARYQKNVAKAGKFQDYTDFYLKRGTDTGGSWLKSVTRGHEMVKTKYDWDDVRGGKGAKNFAR